MPTTVYGGTDDAWVNNTNADWTTCRDATAGNIIDNDHNDINNAFGIYYNYSSGRGGAAYYLRRSYFEFDLSSLSGTCSSATFNVYADMTVSGNNSNDNVRLCKSAAIPAAPGGSATSDDNSCFSKIDLTEDHSDAFTISTTLGYHSVDVNSDGIAAINTAIGSGDYTACLTADGDYANTAPTGQTRILITYADNTDTSKDPYLSLTFPITGYGNDVIGVVGANIGKINGIATADISKINGV